METKTYFLIVDAILFIVLLVFIIRNHKKEIKLLRAMDHFSVVNQATDTMNNINKQEFIADKVVYELEIPKSIGLHSLLNGSRKDYYIEYYSNEIARQLVDQIAKNQALKIDFIYGVENDKIKGSIRYLVEV